MVCRFFYASSACIYPEFKQLETNVTLKESDAWPAEVFYFSLVKALASTYIDLEFFRLKGLCYFHNSLKMLMAWRS